MVGIASSEPGPLFLLTQDGTQAPYGNGADDILWRNPGTGDTGVWAMNNGQATWHDLGITSINPVKA